MSNIGQKERETQNRVVQLFCDRLGYKYLENKKGTACVRPVDDELLCNYLAKNYNGVLIQKALMKFYKTRSLPVALEPTKAFAEPAWQISGFFVPILGPI